MSSSLTLERLRDFLMSSRPSRTPLTTLHKLTKCEYESRYNVLTTRLTKVSDLLTKNHWKLVESYMDMMTSRSKSIDLLTTVCMSTCDRKSTLIYSYLIELYVISRQIELLDERDESSIEYEEISFN